MPIASQWVEGAVVIGNEFIKRRRTYGFLGGLISKLPSKNMPCFNSR
jgi:hypothetical protein